jgi:nitric oxide synthase oxygenase domain/subunit
MTDGYGIAVEVGAAALEQFVERPDDPTLSNREAASIAARAVLDAALATGAVVPAGADGWKIGARVWKERAEAAESRCAELEALLQAAEKRWEANHVEWRDRALAASNRAGQFRFEAEGLRDRLTAAEELLRDWQKWWRRGHLHDPHPIIATDAFLAEGDT